MWEVGSSSLAFFVDLSEVLWVTVSPGRTSVLRSTLTGDRNCSVQLWHAALPVLGVLNQEMSTEEKVGEGLPGRCEHQCLS